MFVTNKYEVDADVVILGLWSLWCLIIVFALWGGYPEGCFTKIRKLQEKVVMLENRNITRIETVKEIIKETPIPTINHKHKYSTGEVWQ